MPGAALILALALAHRPAPASPRGMIMAAAPNREVLLVRRTDDGTLETACVDNDEAAKAFLGGARTKRTKPEEK